MTLFLSLSMQKNPNLDYSFFLIEYFFFVFRSHTSCLGMCATNLANLASLRLDCADTICGGGWRAVCVGGAKGGDNNKGVVSGFDAWGAGVLVVVVVEVTETA